MAHQKKDKLKKLLQSIDLDKPSSDFTAIVLQELQAGTEGEVVVNPALKSLLQTNALEKPTADFTHLVMVQVDELNLRPVLEPIIPLRAWYVIATTVLGLITSVLLSEYFSSSSQKLTSYSKGIGYTVTLVVTQINRVPFLYLLILISLALLLLIDYTFKQKVLFKEKSFAFK